MPLLLDVCSPPLRLIFFIERFSIEQIAVCTGLSTPTGRRSARDRWRPRFTEALTTKRNEMIGLRQ